MTLDTRNQVVNLLEIDKILSRIEKRHEYFAKGSNYIDDDGKIQFMTQYEANAANWNLVQFKLIQEIRQELEIPKGGYK